MKTFTTSDLLKLNSQLVFNDMLTSEATLSCEPMVSSLNKNEIDFRISIDESDNEDCTVIFDKKSFSYKIISVNNLKTDSENDNDKANMPSFPSPKPTVSNFDDLDFFKDFENEFPAIVYNDAQTSKLDLLSEPILNPQHIDEFNLKDETSLSEYDEGTKLLYKVEDITTCLVEYVKFWDDWEVDRYGNANLAVEANLGYYFMETTIIIIENDPKETFVQKIRYHSFQIKDLQRQLEVGSLCDEYPWWKLTRRCWNTHVLAAAIQEEKEIMWPIFVAWNVRYLFVEDYYSEDQYAVSIKEDTADAEEEDKEMEESLYSDSMGMDAEDEGVESLSLGRDDDVPEGQQRTAPVAETAMGEPQGLGYEALRRQEIALGEGWMPSVFEPTLTTWMDLEDGIVYIDVPAYPPPAPPDQTPPSPEWSSGSLPISLVHSIVPSPMISLTVPSPVASHAMVETEGLLTEYDRDIGELFTRSEAVRDEIFFQRCRFRSLEYEQERVVVTFGAIWRPVLALESWAGQTDAQRAALWHAISDTQGENQELQLQLTEERHARLKLAEVIDSIRRRQEPKGDV
ncbi:hypothetical protein Tco_0600984 [Tanacetum coccineum]